MPTFTTAVRKPHISGTKQHRKFIGTGFPMFPCTLNLSIYNPLKNDIPSPLSIYTKITDYFIIGLTFVSPYLY